MIKIWDITTGKIISELKGHEKEVMSVCFSKDGKRLISGSADKTIKEWDITTGQALKTIKAHKGWIRCVLYSPDETYIASGGDDSKIIFWDAKTGEMKNTILAHKNYVQTLSFSPDGRYLASGSHDLFVTLIEVKTGKIIFKSDKQKQYILSVDFNPKGQNFVSSELFGTMLKMWDVSKLNIKTEISKTKATVNWILPAENIFESSVASIKLKACIKSESDISFVKTYINGALFSSETGEDFDSEKECTANYEKNIKLKEGENEIKIVVTNFSGETTSEIKKISYKAATTTLSWKTPAEGETMVEKALFQINACITSNVNILSIDVFNNKKLIQTQKEIILKQGACNYELSKDLTLIEGANEIYIIVNSANGKVESIKKKIYFKPPQKCAISFLSPENGTKTFLSNMQIKVKVQSESELTSLAILNNGIETASFKDIKTESGGIYSFEKQITLNVGENLIKIIAENKAGKSESDIRKINYTIPTKTAISWISPAVSGASSGQKEFNLSVCIKSETDLSELKVIQNGKEIAVEKSLVKSKSTDCTYEYKKVVSLFEGKNEFKISATNIGGSTDSDPMEVQYILPTKPQIVWNAPASATQTSESLHYKISACIKSNNNIKLVAVFLDDKIIYSDKSIEIKSQDACNYSVEKEITLHDGANLLKIVAENETGKVESEIRTINWFAPKEIVEENNKINENKYALIIGNEDYNSYQTGLNSEVNVAFAEKDAKSFKEYAIKYMGVPEENIILKINARYMDMQSALKKMNLIAKTVGVEGEIIFYYAGHGLPDEKTKEPYLMPVDVSGSDIEFAMQLKDIYAKLTEFPVKKVTVFLDACFSGGARGEGLVSARSIKITPKAQPILNNMVVFTSSSGDQSSLPYKVKEHGMFTYFLLKKLEETNGNLSYGELSEYLTKQVSTKSIMENSKEQTPQTIVNPEIFDTWKNFKVK